MVNVITDNFDVWSAAKTAKANGRGRSADNKSSHGIKKLRELILTLAMQGKLVKQDPKDEPSSDLLKRIQVERARLIAEGKIKKDKHLPEISEEERPYELPQGWTWVRINDICRDWGQKVPSQRFTYLDVSAIDNSKGRISQPTEIEASDAPSRARKMVREGTVIYSTVRPYLLNVAVIEKKYDPEPIASTAFAIVHPLGGVLSYYVFWYLRSQLFVTYVESKMLGVAYPAINDSQFFSGLLPLPPLAEQQRIVAKLDELIGLCDELEAQQATQGEAHERLVATLLEALTRNADAQEFVQSRARLAAHFDLLFDTPESLDKLKQTILQLAVQGKLVQQYPNDEPASELLKKIAAEKARLVAAGKIKKDKPLPPVGEDEKPFELPVGWEWIRLPEVYFSISPSGSKLLSSEIQESGTIPVVDQGKRFVAGYTDDSSLLIKIPGPVIVFGDHTTERKFIDFDFVAGADGVKILRPILQDERFFFHQLNGYNLEERGYARHFKVLIEQFYALPPLAEQHRIVAKVDELMGLCDALMARLNGAQTTQIQLADAIVDQAVA
jgi:type I restriction enzyme S subunit